MKSSLPLLFLTLSLFGCGTARSIVETERPKTLVALDSSRRALYLKTISNAERVSSVEGIADFRLASPEISQSISCQIRARRNDAVQLIGSVFFGITVFDALFRSDTIFVNNIFQGELLVGKNSPDNLRRATGVSAEFSQLVDAFLGAPAPTLPLDSLQSVQADNGKVSYRLASDSRVELIDIDSATARVEQVRIYDDGRLLVKAALQDAEKISTDSTVIFLPKLISVTVYDYRRDSLGVARNVTIAYEARRVNAPDFSIDFRLPRSAKRRRLEDIEFLMK